jgi:D-cysteine desulfhydrase
MPPGGATPEGSFGAMGAALELAEQVARGECPRPVHVMVPSGSTCTAAGLLAGFRVAASLGLGFTPQTVPLVTAVRVTPWPITDPWRIANLAHATLANLAAHGGPRLGYDVAQLRAGLDIDGAELRGGYGRITARGERARLAFARAGGPPLDIVYSAKAAAGLIARAPKLRGPIMFWATKSSAPLPRANDSDLARAPAALRRWLVGVERR